MLEDVKAAALIGPAGPEVLADIEQNETAFGEEAIADLISTYKIDLTTATGRDRLIATIGDFPQPQPATLDTWTGSILGATSFMVSTWMSFAPLLLENLASKTSFQQGHAAAHHELRQGGRRRARAADPQRVGHRRRWAGAGCL